MKTLADMTFEYIWLMVFGDDDQIDQDYAIKLQESLSLYFNELTNAEKIALSQAAQRAKNYLLAEPDEHGFSLGNPVSKKQKLMLDGFISGEVFENFF
ncbi:hypothetical protein Mal35_09020 [Gimesia maris]|uniref:hypothetical protein n=1 Tax=Gimesia maris TaxID=122 RepID=UPI00118775F0|nr:hypothetical protein [Gimesia maris]QDT77476.1 hypothetical protein Mal35_09020 [Gimesia maris]